MGMVTKPFPPGVEASGAWDTKDVPVLNTCRLRSQITQGMTLQGRDSPDTTWTEDQQRRPAGQPTFPSKTAWNGWGLPYLSA